MRKKMIISEEEKVEFKIEWKLTYPEEDVCYTMEDSYFYKNKEDLFNAISTFKNRFRMVCDGGTQPQTLPPQKLDGDICVDVVSVKQKFLDGGDFNTFIELDPPEHLRDKDYDYDNQPIRMSVDFGF
tara:strand:+ start:186 stop:566 length:381 start_codon:yes stop_codon:yes gene_type:complete